MKETQSIKLFEDKRIRAIWNEEEEWYFSVVDVVGALSDSSNPTDYVKKLRKRDSILADYIGTNCPQVMMKTESGKNRMTDYKRLGYLDNWKNLHNNTYQPRICGALLFIHSMKYIPTFNCIIQNL